MSRPVTRFTEDFDFTAMNEKLNKDEVWGDLGKSSNEEEDDSQEDDVGFPKPETKPAYVKDDFFDSLYCNSLDGGSHQRRPKFSEQLKKDSETFGHVPRHWGVRGGRGPGQVVDQVLAIMDGATTMAMAMLEGVEDIVTMVMDGRNI